MTDWTRLPDHVNRKVRVALSGAPDIRNETFTLRPAEACWSVVSWGPGEKIGGVLVLGEIVAGDGARATDTVAIITFTADTQPDWLAEIMREVRP